MAAPAATTATPPFASRPRGGRASLPLSLSPRLNRPGHDSNALFGSESQFFLQGSRRFLRSGREASLFALRSTPCRGQNENLTRRAPHCRAQLLRDDAGRRVSSGHVMGVARDSDPLRIGRAYRHDPRGHPRLLGCARPGGAARSDRRDNAGCRSSRPLLNSDDPGRSGHALHARGRPVAPYAPRLCERRATAGRAKSPQGGWHMIRLLPFPLAAAGLFALWLLLSQAFSLGHVLVGGALSLI